MGAKLGKEGSPKKSHGVSETNLEAKMIQAMQRRAAQGTAVKSFYTIILKFPKIDESFRKCRAIFEEFDKDKNGIIDPEELKQSLHKLEVSFTEEEFGELFNACDINDDMGINFNEFIVFLCLVYLLKNDSTTGRAAPNTPQIDMPSLEATFETLVDAFVFLDKNKDGHVSRSEMVQAINETTSGEGSSGLIAMRRFEEMDWDKNGMVCLKEFLFAFTRWVGVDDADDEECA